VSDLLTEERIASTVAAAASALEDARVAYGLMGGLASSVYGRPRATEDIDFLVKPTEASRALEALGEAGFETEETNPSWIYKATRDGLTADLMFGIYGGIYLDDEMLAHATLQDVAGGEVRVLAPEDIVVIKAVSHDDASPRHWYDALAILAGAEIDWDYLVHRSSHGARRMLSLLIYAQSVDLIVPEEPIRKLFEAIYEGV
jgi:predicted nucleotidyltransferase